MKQKKYLETQNITWLIDLDNTLHNASHAIFPAIHVNMNRYIATFLGDENGPADEATVDAIRVKYWEKYGATLSGLIKHHGVNPTDFLHQTHRIENLPQLLKYETGLVRLLKQLPGRKILFTNAPRHYAQQVIRHLKLHRSFDRHISIEAMRVHGQLRPKPSRWLLKKIIAKQKLCVHRSLLVEDTLENLRVAKRLGMKTVWVTQYVKANAYATCGRFVDLRVRSVKQIAQHSDRLLSNEISRTSY